MTVSYRMQGGGYGWFGDEAHKDVNVVAAVYDASVVSVDLPAQMTAGRPLYGHYCYEK